MRSGFSGLAGRPNVGKSTLTNALCGSHVAIVSDKPQTTRQRALGVVHGDDFQIVLVDLPGFQKPFDALTRRMQRSVDTSLGDVDAVLLAEDGRTFEGVNVENGSIGLTICAERSACVQAVGEGARRFTAIGVATHPSARTGSPCGACRQFLSEFGLDLVVVYQREGEVVAEPLSQLLPAAFELQA